VDSEALEVSIDSVKVNENGVGADKEIATEKPFKGNAWIQKLSQPQLTQKSQRTNFQR
jgi:hypothetical protein